MRALLLAAVAALSLAGCTRPADAEKKSPPPKAHTEGAVPIENFAKVADGVYRGAQPDDAGFKALKTLGVKTIVNLRAKHDDKPFATPLGMQVVEIPMKAKLKIAPPDDEEIRAFLAAVTDPARQPVFVHCAQGKDRTGTLCAMYRMEVEHWPAEKAYDEMKSFGWHDDMYPKLGEFVRGYKPHVLAAKPAR